MEDIPEWTTLPHLLGCQEQAFRTEEVGERLGLKLCIHSHLGNSQKNTSFLEALTYLKNNYTVVLGKTTCLAHVRH
jgi:hypothetical protein